MYLSAVSHVGLIRQNCNDCAATFSQTNETMTTEQLETHPLLPSGEWEGFYRYNDGSQTQHKMTNELTFQHGVVTGSGLDSHGPYNWKGNYDLGAMRVSMTKSYSSHIVLYAGDVDENGIWGTWEIPYDLGDKFNPEVTEYVKNKFCRGGFHLWPKKGEKKSEALEAEEPVLASTEPALDKPLEFSPRSPK